MTSGPIWKCWPHSARKRPCCSRHGGRPGRWLVIHSSWLPSGGTCAAGGGADRRSGPTSRVTSQRSQAWPRLSELTWRAERQLAEYARHQATSLFEPQLEGGGGLRYGEPLRDQPRCLKLPVAQPGQRTAEGQDEAREGDCQGGGVVHLCLLVPVVGSGAENQKADWTV